MRFEATPSMKGIASMDELGPLSGACGLIKPWNVSDYKFSQDDGRLELWSDFAKEMKFPCSSCVDSPEAELHDTLGNSRPRKLHYKINGTRSSLISGPSLTSSFRYYPNDEASLLSRFR
jgi:hypothetical protein